MRNILTLADLLQNVWLRNTFLRGARQKHFRIMMTHNFVIRRHELRQWLMLYQSTTVDLGNGTRLMDSLRQDLQGRRFWLAFLFPLAINNFWA
jgi:hypothetical protein